MLEHDQLGCAWAALHAAGKPMAAVAAAAAEMLGSSA